MSLRPPAARPEGRSPASEQAQRALGQRLLILAITCYRYFVSPLLPPRCRFLPTCSCYAIEAVDRHGVVHGGWLTLRRVARCHPWGGSGLDPVPARRAAARNGL